MCINLLRVRDYHPVSFDFPDIFHLNLYTTISPTTPICKHTGLGSSAFARHYLRNHYYFLFLSLLRCFSSGGLTFGYVFNIAGFPIRTSADQRSLATSRSFSQLNTSFVSFESLGIPRTPF